MRSTWKSGALIVVTIQGADQGDTATISETLAEAEAQLDALIERAPEHADLDAPVDVVADKGSPQRCRAAGDRRRGPPAVHLGTGAWTTQLEGRRRAARGVLESAADSWKPGPTTAEDARRAHRVLLRAHVRDRWLAAHAPTRSRQHPQTHPRPRRRFQPGPADAVDVWKGHSSGPSGPSIRRFPPSPSRSVTLVKLWLPTGSPSVRPSACCYGLAAPRRVTA